MKGALIKGIVCVSQVACCSDNLNCSWPTHIFAAFLCLRRSTLVSYQYPVNVLASDILYNTCYITGFQFCATCHYTSFLCLCSIFDSDPGTVACR
jgi:hypothetical protein